MNSISDYLENKLVDHALGVSAYTPGATLTLKLYTAAPSDSGGGTEVTGGSYAAVSIANNTTNFPPCDSGGTKKINGAVFQFPTATAAWGTVTHWGLFEGANLLVWGTVSPSNYVAIGDAPRFQAGDLTICELLNASSGGFTAEVRRKLLDLVFGRVAYSIPNDVYAAAGTSLSGEALSEWTDTGYSRGVITFGAASGGVGTSTDAQTLNSSVVADGVTITHWAIFDDLTSGNVIATGPVTTPRTPVIGDLVRFSAGEITVTVQ